MMVEGGSTSPGGAILVIDDEEAVLSIAARMLQRIGYRAITAGNGQTGIERFREYADQFVCVILDMTMPDMSGEVVCRAIQAIDPAVRIIVMSGHAEEDMHSRMNGFKLAGFLPKPFNLEMLRTAIARVVGSTG